MSFPGADAFGGGVGGVGSPHGNGGAKCERRSLVAHVRDHTCASGVHGETERGVGALDVSGGRDNAGGVGELCGNLEKNNSPGIVGVGGGGHHAKEVAIRGKGGATGGDTVGGPSAVFGVPCDDGGADGLGDGGDFRFFGRLQCTVDGGDGETGEEADDGNDDQQFNEGEGRYGAERGVKG